MKKILGLAGVQILSKQQQQNIKGEWDSLGCCPTATGRGCLVRFGSQNFCKPGYCDRWGRCLF
ncbi:hypothetical protein [Aquimarina aquimarini]|uniref:hypothetical protein n=1 Tax=Aquimarina aquimarini TaxID=1191734 RepID=UPI000D5580B7|nr:hypothetical protein [Aquimarina aquimarini]